MLSLTFNTDSYSPKKSLILSGSNPVSPSCPLEVTLGDNLPLNIILWSVNNSAIDTRSGVAGYSIKVGLGLPGTLPSGGTYIISFGGYSTTALAYNSSAALIQAALQGLTSIGANNCVVSGSFPNYQVQFIGALALAPQALMSASGSLLTPNSDVNIGNVQIGSGTQNAIQSIILQAQPVVLNATWTPTTPPTLAGWTGTLVFDTEQLVALFNGTTSPQQAILEIKLYAAGVAPICVGSPQITIYHRVIDDAAIAQGPFANTLRGTTAIGSGVDNVDVVGQVWPSVPVMILAWIKKPAGGYNISATWVAGSESTAGFAATLDGVTDSAGYVLNWIVFF